MSAQKLFTPLAAKVAAGDETANASNISSATYVLVQNPASADTDYLVTLEAGATGVVQGTFTIMGQESIIIKKSPTDEIWAANTAVDFTKVMVTEG